MGISNTGHAKEIVRAIAAARAAGAASIGVSRIAGGPLIESCDVGLVVETLENTDVFTPTVSRRSLLVVVDILSTAASLRPEQAHHDKLAEMTERLARIRPGDYTLQPLAIGCNRAGQGGSLPYLSVNLCGPRHGVRRRGQRFRKPPPAARPRRGSPPTPP